LQLHAFIIDNTATWSLVYAYVHKPLGKCAQGGALYNTEHVSKHYH
jgi:hypothetical protein